jgi:hypothetical protein
MKSKTTPQLLARVKELDEKAIPDWLLSTFDVNQIMYRRENGDLCVLMTANKNYDTPNEIQFALESRSLLPEVAGRLGEAMDLLNEVLLLISNEGQCRGGQLNGMFAQSKRLEWYQKVDPVRDKIIAAITGEKGEGNEAENLD